MSGYRRVNYYELCRLCTSSEGDKMNIFRDEGRRRQLQTKIQNYLPVQVLEEDSLPKIVCHECVRKLENYIEFRETVVNAEGMLESYFTSLRFSEDFLKEGKVYVKSTEKDHQPPSPQEDPLKIEKIVDVTPTVASQIIIEPQQPQHQPIVVGNLNASNIQIISGVQARVQQYKCAMQMQPGGVAAAVVEATAETHYSYQQQTSQQVSPQHQSTHVNRLTDQQTPQIQVQNQIQSQSQINQLQSTRQVQNTQQPNQQQQQSQPQQNQPQPQPQATQIPQQPQRQQTQQQQQQQQCQMTQMQIREFEKRLQIEKQVRMSPQEQNQTQVHQNNNVLTKTEIATDQNQQRALKSEVVESSSINSPNENVQNYATVQASPEVFLSLGFKEAGLNNTQQTRDDTKDFRDYIKNTTDDALSRNSIGQISEFLRIRSCPEPSTLITVNPQVICQTSRSFACRECGKTFDSENQLNSHQCPSSPTIDEMSDISKEEHVQNNTNLFNCDICSKPFKRKEHLFQHRKLHTGERPYICTTCTKAFSRKEHLVRHSVSHTGQKMHECEMCGKSFSRKDNLHKHRKTHGVAGPYICETCGKSFVVKHYYLVHLGTHAPIDGENCPDPLPYKCDLCHKAFSVKQYLATHKARHRKNANASANNVTNQQPTAQQTQQAQQQQQQQQVPTVQTSNGINVSSNGVTNTNGQTNDNSVVEIHSVIERNDSQARQQQQQHGSFDNNQYHGNIQQFQ